MAAANSLRLYGKQPYCVLIIAVNGAARGTRLNFITDTARTRARSAVWCSVFPAIASYISNCANGDCEASRAISP